MDLAAVANLLTGTVIKRVITNVMRIARIVESIAITKINVELVRAIFVASEFVFSTAAVWW